METGTEQAFFGESQTALLPPPGTPRAQRPPRPSVRPSRAGAGLCPAPLQLLAAAALEVWARRRAVGSPIAKSVTGGQRRLCQLRCRDGEEARGFGSSVRVLQECGLGAIVLPFSYHPQHLPFPKGEPCLPF